MKTKTRFAWLLIFGALVGPFAFAATDSADFVKESPITTKVKEKLSADRMNNIEVETDRKGEVQWVVSIVTTILIGTAIALFALFVTIPH